MIMGGSKLNVSPNSRPGEPLRSWHETTPVVDHDAMSVVTFANARDALARLIAREPLSLQDQVALGRLNSYCVVQGYEPIVSLLREPYIEPETAEFFGHRLTQL